MIKNHEIREVINRITVRRLQERQFRNLDRFRKTVRRVKENGWQHEVGHHGDELDGFLYLRYTTDKNKEDLIIYSSPPLSILKEFGVV